MRALDIDRRIIFIFVFLGVAIPLMVDFTLPIKPTPPVISAYDAFEKVAAEKPGSTILLSFSYGASTAPEMQPMARAVLRHCFRLGFKVVAICLWPDGVGLAEAVLKQVSEEFGKKEDIDYAFLGYKPGTTAVILNMGQDLHTAFPVDSKGVSLADVPVTKDIHPLTDFSFVFDFAAGDSGFSQAIANRIGGEGRVVLDAAKPLFLCRRDNLAIAKKARRRIVIETTDAEDVHP